MRSFNKTLLSSAIAVLAANTSCSASADMMTKMVDDSTLDIKLRNAYFSKTDKYGGFEHNVLGEKKEIRQWAQSAEVNFSSGYFGTEDFGIGADVSYYGAVKLAADEDSNTSGDLLPQGDSGDINNYGKLGQGFVKLQALDMINLQAGRMVLDNPIVASSGSRLTPSSFDAVQGQLSIADFGFYAVYTDEWSPRNQSGTREFDAGGKDIDDIIVFGATYNHDSGFGAEIAYGESDDFVEKLMLNAYYTFKLGEDRSIDLDAQYYTFEDAGNLWTDATALTTTSKADKLDAKTYSLRAAYNTNDWTFALTYTKNKDDKAYYYMYQDEKGEYDHGMTYLYTSMQVSDFLAKEEDVYQGLFSYDFSSLGVPGLNASYSYTYGKDGEWVSSNRADPDNGKEYNEWESEYKISYTIQGGPLKDLSLSYNYASYSNNAPASRSGETFDVIEQDDHRVYVDYTISVF
ncbi:OprD family porin [Aestuariirhabdus sp. Z084]|uniref:OprD family outer membrane porin n=1 Tax=Aestuariirhabdus haliotis TaxID=2918751 RepID=UPI00201B3AD7|nr:OprD family outer membrane porin [Aestuariirhabdus haliotis]MCL6416314.1 OprD family porin [Aestuariirhabdus haliotis]MCL6420187.1 OprD family porin [Aestuariirhabdus haliotis]